MDPIQLETLKALIGADGLYPDQEGALNEQMAYAQALRGSKPTEHSTGLGAVLGGIANGLNVYRGERDSHDLMAKRDALYKDKASKMRGILDMMASHGQPQQQAPYAVAQGGAPYAVRAPQAGDPEGFLPPTFG